VNTADAQTLEALPGIGSVTARQIVAYRTAHGPFQSVDQLDDVPGIGAATIDALRDLVTVEKR
jgi:competence protein ComEA